MSAPEVMTIGYEGKTVDTLVDTLLSNRVARVADVRQLPLSRRRGFSKTSLAAALAEAGIEYLHMRTAGNPYRHDAGTVREVLAKYRRHVEATPATLRGLREVVAGARSALLCFEADATCCHRSVLTALLRGESDRVRVRDLSATKTRKRGTRRNTALPACGRRKGATYSPERSRSRALPMKETPDFFASLVTA